MGVWILFWGLQQGMEDVASTSAMRGYLGGDMGRDVEWV